MPFLSALRVVFGGFAVLFLPGLVWTFAFWPAGRLDGIERIAFSVALSLAFIPLSLFLVIVFGITMTGLTVLGGVVTLTFAGAATMLYRRRNAIQTSTR